MSAVQWEVSPQRAVVEAIDEKIDFSILPAPDLIAAARAKMEAAFSSGAAVAGGDALARRLASVGTPDAAEAFPRFHEREQAEDELEAALDRAYARSPLYRALCDTAEASRTYHK